MAIHASECSLSSRHRTILSSAKINLPIHPGRAVGSAGGGNQSLDAHFALQSPVVIPPLAANTGVTS